MKRIASILLLSLFFSCNSTTEKTVTDPNYFDLGGYFAKEADRLKKENPSVTKTVFINGKAEEKTLKIADWVNELQSFSNADINKASWRGEFTAQQNDSSKTYTSNSAKIPVKSVFVKLVNNNPVSIQIILKNENTLYKSHDTLEYVPNDFYRIIKSQKIKLMEQKNYKVIGKFN